MKTKLDNLIGVFYPDDLPKNRHELTTMCLLFDQIMFHGITGGMACGGGYGMLGDIWNDAYDAEELIDAGVILLEEEDQDGITGGEFYEKDFGKYYQIQVTINALRKSEEQNAIPFTTKADLNLPLEIINPQIFKDEALFQSIPLSQASLDLVLPNFKAMSNQEILEARDKLEEHLIPFRSSMLTLCPLIRETYKQDSSFDEIQKEAIYIVDTRILPLLTEMQRRIETEKQNFLSRLLVKASSIVSKMTINWLSKGVIVAAVESIPEISKLAIGKIESDKSIESLMATSGMGFLLSVSELIEKE